MSIAVEGYGSFIERSPNGVSFTTMAEVTKINGPKTKVTSVDVTHLLSPSNCKEYLSGMVDEGEIALELNMTAGEYTALRGTLVLATPSGGGVFGLASAAVAGTAAEPFWRINFSTGTVGVGQGFITDLEPTASVDDKLSVSVTIKCTGLWVII